jgi:crossover junction endodeoxyribonuclease RusA
MITSGRLTIEGEPVAKARPRLGKYGNIYTPKESRVYEELVAWYAKRLPRYKGSVVLNVEFYCHPHRKMPDLDNLLKSLLDGLQKGGAIADDVQVSEIHARRLFDKENPRVELHIVSL